MMKIPRVRVPKIKAPKLKKNQKRFLAVSFIVLAFLFSTPYLFGGLEDTEVNINTIAAVSLEAKVGIAITPLGTLGTISVSSIETVFQDVTLRAKVVMNTGNPLPTAFKAILYVVIGGAVIETQTTYTTVVTNSIVFFTFQIDNAPQGTTLCAVRFAGEYGQDADGTFRIITGSSYSIYIANPFVAQPNPIELSEVADYTQEPFVATTLHWTYNYAGTSQAKIVEDSAVLETKNLAATSIPQTYSYIYTPTVSGDRELKLIITPTDGSSNVAKTDTVIVHVNPGGEEQDFPPSADSIYISMDVPIYPIGIVWDYGWGLGTSTPMIGLQEYAVSGTINVQVVANPKGALSSVSIWVYEGNIIDGVTHTEYQMETTFEASGAVDLWIGSINTEILDAGTHTLEIYGTDNADGHAYLLAQVNLAVRTLSLGGMLIIGAIIMSIPVTLIIMRRVNNFWLNKRKRPF